MGARVSYETQADGSELAVRTKKRVETLTDELTGEKEKVLVIYEEVPKHIPRGERYRVTVYSGPHAESGADAAIAFVIHGSLSSTDAIPLQPVLNRQLADLHARWHTGDKAGRADQMKRVDPNAPPVRPGSNAAPPGAGAHEETFTFELAEPLGAFGAVEFFNRGKGPRSEWEVLNVSLRRVMADGLKHESEASAAVNVPCYGWVKGGTSRLFFGALACLPQHCPAWMRDRRAAELHRYRSAFPIAKNLTGALPATIDVRHADDLPRDERLYGPNAATLDPKLRASRLLVRRRLSRLLGVQDSWDGVDVKQNRPGELHGELYSSGEEAYRMGRQALYDDGEASVASRGGTQFDLLRASIDAGIEPSELKRAVREDGTVDAEVLASILPDDADALAAAIALQPNIDDVQLRLEDFLHEDTLKSGLPAPALAGFNTWAEDVEFGRRVLQGCHPSVLRACRRIPSCVRPPRDALVPYLRPGFTLEDEAQAGRVFALDYAFMREHCPEDADRPSGWTRHDKCCTAPLCLMYLADDPLSTRSRDGGGRNATCLVPIAIVLHPALPSAEELMQAEADRLKRARGVSPSSRSPTPPASAESSPVASAPAPEPSSSMPPTFTPADSVWDWRTAKAHVMCADSQYHFLGSFYLRSHAVLEPFALSLRRHLSPMHPLFKLLRPHLRYVLSSAVELRRAIVDHGTIADTLFGVAASPKPLLLAMHVRNMRKQAHEATLRQEDAAQASKGKRSGWGRWAPKQEDAKKLEEDLDRIELPSSGVDSFLRDEYSRWRFEDMAFPATLLERGLDGKEKLQNYPYRDDGILLWSSLVDFVDEYVKIYYVSDADVANDRELQAFWNEVVNVGHKKREFPFRKLDHVDAVCRMCATLLWMCTGQHSSVRYSMYDEYGAVMFRPPHMRGKPPTERGKCSEITFLDSLPNISDTVAMAALGAVLSGTSERNPRLMDLNVYEEYINDPRAKQALARFSNACEKVESVIAIRNQRRHMPYPFMMPSRVGLSPGI